MGFFNKKLVRAEESVCKGKGLGQLNSNFPTDCSRINPSPNDEVLDFSKSKALADDNFNAAQMTKIVS